jgi:O-antigen/teichoic acid export membrane protein
MLDWKISDRFLRNSIWLFGGSGVGALLGVVSTVLAARLLGPAQFGVMTLIMVYANINERLFNFQTWQALIRYGARANESRDRAGFRKLVKLCVLLDLVGALLGAAVAYFAAGLIAILLQLDPLDARLLTIFCLVITFRVVGTATGVLRLFDRFPLLSAHTILLNGLILAGTFVTWIVGAGLAELLLVLGISQLIAHVTLFGWAWRTLADNGLHSVASEPLRGIGDAAPGIFRFLLWTNLESSVKILRDLDIFVIKLLLNVEAVGLYQVARRIAQFFELTIAPFTYAIYPEFSRQIADGDRAGFTSLLRTSALLVGSAATIGWVGFLLLGDAFLQLAFGDAYLGSYGVAGFCLLGTTIWAWAQPISPAMFSLGIADRAFVIHLTVASLYLVSLVVFIEYFGLLGAGASYAILYISWAALSVRVLVNKLSEPSELNRTN